MVLISCGFVKFSGNKYKLPCDLGAGRQFSHVKLMSCGYHLSSTVNAADDHGGVGDGMWALQSH